MRRVLAVLALLVSGLSAVVAAMSVAGAGSAARRKGHGRRLDIDLRP